MSTSFGFDWYLQCFMHIFEYKKSNKKQSTSQLEKITNERKHNKHISPILSI